MVFNFEEQERVSSLVKKKENKNKLMTSAIWAGLAMSRVPRDVFTFSEELVDSRSDSINDASSSGTFLGGREEEDLERAEESQRNLWKGP